MMRALLLCLAACLLRGDEQTKRLASRLAEEADAFRRIAPQVLGEETLHQRTLKPPPRFRPRIGDAAKEPLKPTWQEREIRSEYAYGSFTGEGGAIHELRQVLSVDGKKTQDPEKAVEILAKIVTASDDGRKKQLLKDFEKHGLSGAVTDFGQMLLLFTPREIGRFEFTYRRAVDRGEERLLVFGYKQIDGPESLTVIEARKADRTTQLPIQGEVWVGEADYTPARITMSVSQPGEGAALRHEASVQYAMSPHGALLPVSTVHREVRGGQIVAENLFSYAGFKKFGASSDIKFEVDPAAEPEPRR
jgi:hypothetical protein